MVVEAPALPLRRFSVNLALQRGSSAATDLPACPEQREVTGLPTGAYRASFHADDPVAERDTSEFKGGPETVHEIRADPPACS